MSRKQQSPNPVLSYSEMYSKMSKAVKEKNEVIEHNAYLEVAYKRCKADFYQAIRDHQALRIKLVKVRFFWISVLLIVMLLYTFYK